MFFLGNEPDSFAGQRDANTIYQGRHVLYHSKIVSIDIHPALMGTFRAEKTSAKVAAEASTGPFAPDLQSFCKGQSLLLFF
jgi:hypothetical protein